jgi:hypothetical protein
MKAILILAVLSVPTAFAGDSLKCNNETIEGNLTVSAPTFQSGIRTKSDILRVAMRNLSNLRKIYAERLKTGLRYEGKVIVKYGIGSKGIILFASADSTDISDTIFIRKLIENVKSWEYGPISSIHDTSVIKYPFKFEINNKCK